MIMIRQWQLQLHSWYDYDNDNYDNDKTMTITFMTRHILGEKRIQLKTHKTNNRTTEQKLK